MQNRAAPHSTIAVPHSTVAGPHSTIVYCRPQCLGGNTSSPSLPLSPTPSLLQSLFTTANLQPPFQLCAHVFSSSVPSNSHVYLYLTPTCSHSHFFLPTGPALLVTHPAHPNQAPVAVLAAHQGSTPLSRGLDSLAVPPPRAWASLRSFWRRWAGGRGRV